MKEAYRISLTISFVQKLKGLTDKLFASLSFIVMHEGGAIYAWIEIDE